MYTQLFAQAYTCALVYYIYCQLYVQHGSSASLDFPFCFARVATETILYIRLIESNFIGCYRQSAFSNCAKSNLSGAYSRASFCCSNLIFKYPFFDLTYACEHFLFGHYYKTTRRISQPTKGKY